MLLSLNPGFPVSIVVERPATMVKQASRGGSRRGYMVSHWSKRPNEVPIVVPSHQYYTGACRWSLSQWPEIRLPGHCGVPLGLSLMGLTIFFHSQ
jgi:hypothetical protein